jgi:hypothetical protein
MTDTATAVAVLYSTEASFSLQRGTFVQLAISVPSERAYGIST